MASSNGDTHVNIKELGLDFRRYLERGKFNEEMSKALLALYSEREWPRNPNEYICRKLAESCNLTLLDDRNNDLIIARDKIRELEMTVAKLREELYKSKREKLGKKHKE